jgi:hypothetical protein
MLIRATLDLLLCALVANAQSMKKAPRKVPVTDKPTCSAGAICFTARVAEGQEYRQTLSKDLEFVLRPGWNITIVPAHPEGNCNEFASVVNPPYRAHRDLYIDMSYGWTAEEEVSSSPREFDFVTNCADFRTESERLNIVMWPYTATKEKYEEALAKLGTSLVGKGRLWITDSKVSHVHDSAQNKSGRIEWMSFAVEIRLPRP